MREKVIKRQHIKVFLQGKMNDNRKFEIEKVFMLDNLHFKP